MGIRRLGNFNSALLGKWLWRYGSETDALWRRVIEAKYGNIWGGWCTKKVTSPYGVRRRCGDCTLQEAFPELYYLSRSKDSSVAEVMGWSAGRFH